MRLNITIQGTTPLICNRFTDAAAESSSGGVRGSGSAQDRGTPLEIAESKLYKGLEGTFIRVRQGFYGHGSIEK